MRWPVGEKGWTFAPKPTSGAYKKVLIMRVGSLW